MCYGSLMATRKRAAKPATETAPVQEDTVTDINETETVDATEGQEPQEGTADAGHTFNVGDVARVIRGKLRGQNGKIIAFNEGDKTYAITLESGTLAVVNAANLKAPADSTVSIQALVKVLSSFQFADPSEAVRLASALDEFAPGTSAKLNEATAV